MSKRYARFLTAVFCLFLGGLMVWQMLLPDRERSDVENRTLQQRPALTLSSVLDGSYMEDVEACNMILKAFGLDPAASHIISGHIPVKRGKGSSRKKSGQQ